MFTALALKDSCEFGSLARRWLCKLATRTRNTRMHVVLCPAHAKLYVLVVTHPLTSGRLAGRQSSRPRECNPQDESIRERERKRKIFSFGLPHMYLCAPPRWFIQSTFLPSRLLHVEFFAKSRRRDKWCWKTGEIHLCCRAEQQQGLEVRRSQWHGSLHSYSLH